MRKRSANTIATEAESSRPKEHAGAATVGGLLEEMDRLHHRQEVLSQLLDFLHDNFFGIEQDPPKARIARADGSMVPPREDVVAAIAEEISVAAAASRDRLGAILAARVQGPPTKSVPCVSPDGPDNRLDLEVPAVPHPRASISSRARGSTKRGSARKRSAIKAPAA